MQNGRPKSGSPRSSLGISPKQGAAAFAAVNGRPAAPGRVQALLRLPNAAAPARPLQAGRGALILARIPGNFNHTLKKSLLHFSFTYDIIPLMFNG